MYRNIFDEAKEVKAEAGECFRFNANSGDVIRVKGLDNVNLICYDSDGNLIGKIPVTVSV